MEKNRLLKTLPKRNLFIPVIARRYEETQINKLVP